uniref:Alpha/beta hydrolase fold-3 domain-containing protein n=1 Tax=Oryza barthii TaxID=65489 RepID=A0A0D3H1C0_9ORYZ
MDAAPTAPPAASADDEIVYESMPCIRIYKNRVERYFGSEFGDVLRDRGRAYYDRLTSSGWRGEAEIWQAPEKGHTFHLLEPHCDAAIAQDKVISGFLNR